MHGGNPHKVLASHGMKVAPERIIDFSVSVNPAGFHPDTRLWINRGLEDLLCYPDPDYSAFRGAAAALHDITDDCVWPANGSSELLLNLLRAVAPDQVLIPVPAYIDYAAYAERLGIPVAEFVLTSENDFRLDTDALLRLIKERRIPAVIIGNPNNPTGRPVEYEALRTLIGAAPDTLFIIDDAYRDLADNADDPPPLFANSVVLRSLTKNFAIPGLRIAYAVGGARWIAVLRREFPVWHLNALSARTGCALLDEGEFLKTSRIRIAALRGELQRELETIKGLQLFPSAANFLLFRLRYGDPRLFYRALLRQGLVLRDCSDYRGLEDGYFRCAVRSAEENMRLAVAIRDFFTPPVSKSSGRRRTPSLMFQGTSSNAGKSLMTAALCRILADEGCRVAPFKAQNMSLNSFVTREGDEMGRAQVLQARAARQEPHVLMNPVLLKPNRDTHSQVIVMGKPLGTLSAKEYFTDRNRLRETVHEAYDRLCGQYDAVILEGAGSPGEVNLKKRDIVNMSMAAHARSPVILVGDIDLGGVYASFVGHMDVMEEWERKLVKGFLVNKFRGDQSFLQDAHDYVFNYTGVPVVGVMPYIRDHRLPEEDGVDFEERYRSNGEIRIGVVELAHVSNSTDLDPFLSDPDVRLIRVREAGDLTDLHAVIIPGSKNVISDLRKLESRGIPQKISEMAGKIPIMGICGGFQMLGARIADPGGIEGVPGNRIDGMNLLPITTELAAAKQLRQTVTVFNDDGSRVEGYEIHHGVSTCPEELELFADPGLGCRKGRVWGTYLHGVFDNPELRAAFIRQAADQAGIGTRETQCERWDLDGAIDAFADVFRKSVDLDDIKRIMGL